MRQRRTWAEAAALRDAGLERWAAGASLSAIAAELGVTVGYVGNLLQQARRRGEANA